VIDIKSTLKNIKKNNLYRVRKVITSAQDMSVVIDKKKYINFSSNNYLNLSNDKELKEYAIKLTSKYGVGAGSSPMISGYTREHQDLERYISKILDFESSIVMSSGYLCNVGIINALAQSKVTIIQDKMNHNSIVEGTRLSTCELIRYKHNSLIDLIKKIKENKGKKIIIYTDAVFSMTGEIADLERLSDISDTYGTKLIVDDAHGFGVLESKGSDFPCSLNYFDRQKLKIEAYIGTFGKAVGTLGSFVASNKDLVDLIIQKSKPYIYSTSLPAMIVGATKKSIGIISTTGEKVKRLRTNINFFRKGFKSSTLKLSESITPIQIIKIGCSKKVTEIQERALRDGLFIQAIRYPTVPRNCDLLRINLSCGHTRSQISKLLTFLSRL
tara:strand:+ start:236 stop:1390 length:1155 start_codon:yes stop_codon:yes gene_type:complete